MATQPEIVDLTDEEDIDLDAEDQPEADEAEDTSEGEAGEGDEDDGEQAGDADASDEDVISFGGVDLRDEDEPEHISDLRRRYREQQRRLRELEEATAPKVEDIGPKPNLDDYWDKDDPQGAFERDLLAWNDRKTQASLRLEQEREQQQALQREYEADVGQLETQRASLKVRDFDAAYDRVTGSLTEAQQAILVQVANNKAALVYALGKNPDRLDKLKAITNLAKFAGEVARLDMETRVSRKPTTKPEGVVRGAGTMNGKGATDAKLARLEAEAEKTGNRTPLIQYRKTLRQQGRL
ncbi:hypothetical protein IC614_03025 [Allosphingosinicella flava]|uniref:Scaffolding protein n=1 Tax=Allosphingosinicella flava TaxID=2771430 RepID=A0A7T2GKL6_9SPHN|nr:hypothetical protein [Sphingosinicella flava]QPQ55589.1 hypothetical protein IC614_03025 [Sphingosinicella flava]